MVPASANNQATVSDSPPEPDASAVSAPQRQEAPAPTPPAVKPWPAWVDGLQSVGGAFCQWLSRPRVRLTITGVILLLIGGVLLMGSVWTLPLVLVGALMVVVAWIGHRLEGRFALEWGDAGTQLAFRAQIKPAQPVRRALPRASANSQKHPDEPDADTIEGKAHTVEIEVSELTELLAAAEGKDGDASRTDASAKVARALRVASAGNGSS